MGGISRRDVLLGAAGLGAAATLGSGSFRLAAAATLEGTWDGDDFPVAAGTTPPFCHGVASGDPSGTSVVLWTRLTVPAAQAEPIAAEWWVARDPAGVDVVARGTARTTAARDWTVKVHAVGLAARTTYWYGFRALGADSPVGRTRTAPSVASGVGLAVVSCSSYWSGWFNAYRRIAERDDVDLVVHCGDHIYDFVDEDEWRRARLDRFDLADVDFRDWLTLAEVRRRYALWYSDADFVALHAAHPMTIAWDNHDIDPGPVAPADVRSVFWEWTPTRPPVHTVDADGQLVPVDPTRDYRRVVFGGVELFLLDVRTMRTSTSILGDAQRSWLQSYLRRSSTLRKPWRVVVTPTPIAQFDVGGAPARGDWGNYRDERAALLGFLEANAIDDTLFVAGDSHGAFVSDLPVDQRTTYDPATGEGSVAVELLANSVTRGGADETIAGQTYRTRYGHPPFGDRATFEALLPAARTTAIALEAALQRENPCLRYVNWRDHGYGMVHLDLQGATLEEWLVPIEGPSADEQLGVRLRVERGTNRIARA